MLDVSRDQLLRSFRRLRAAQITLIDRDAEMAIPAGLLKFYAAEVGLKFQFLFLKNLHKASQLIDVSGKPFSHDLDRLVAAVNMPRSAVPMPIFVSAPHAGTVNEIKVKVSDVHQAWRYGRDLDGADEQAMHKWLDCILSYLERIS